MDKNQLFECAGDLFEELDEVKKIIRNEDEIEQRRTITVGCNSILSFICC